MQSYFLNDLRSNEDLTALMREIIAAVGTDLSKPDHSTHTFAILDDERKVHCRLETNGADEYLALSAELADRGFKTVRRSRRTKDYDHVWRHWPAGFDQG